MRIAIIPMLILLAVAPASAQDPDRRAEELRRMRMLEALRATELRTTVLQRGLLEAQLAASAGLSRLELEHAALATQRALRAAQPQVASHLLEAQLAGAANAAHGLEVQRALVEAQAAQLAHGQPEAAYRALLEAQLAAVARAADVATAADVEFQPVLDRIAERGPAEAWASQDPADSLYTAAREQLNRGNYREAVRLFNRISAELRFAKSEYRPAAYYWQAFALARLGSAADLRRARNMLSSLKDEYPRNDLIGDAASLGATIDARLARNGDAQAMQNLSRAAREVTNLSLDLTRAAQPPSTTAALTAASRQQQCEDDDIRSVALNALLQMESANALPILREVMTRRDACSVALRRRALMMLAQHQTGEVQEILIQAALEDPDPEIREQATFWLSHVHGDAAVEALARILGGNPSAGVREKALFALGQHPSSHAAEILREYALRTDVPEELRRHIVFSLAHSTNTANAAFLRELYDRTDDRDEKQQIIMSLSHNATPEYADWLIGIASDANEHVDVRRQALLLAAHNQAVATDRLTRLYDQMNDAELRRYLILMLGQRVPNDRAAVDKLIDVARTTDDTELQKQVIFMLGHANDPRVAELLAEIIRRPVR